jgi:hypothetical protein
MKAQALQGGPAGRFGGGQSLSTMLPHLHRSFHKSERSWLTILPIDEMLSDAMHQTMQVGGSVSQLARSSRHLRSAAQIKVLLGEVRRAQHANPDVLEPRRGAFIDSLRRLDRIRAIDSLMASRLPLRSRRLPDLQDGLSAVKPAAVNVQENFMSVTDRRALFQTARRFR